MATLTRHHQKRLREMYRSAGWPCLDGIEIDLLAAGLLERVTDRCDGGAITERLRLTNAGIRYLADTTDQHRRQRSAHEELVAEVAKWMQREGRIAWQGLQLRARVSVETEPSILAA